MAPFQVQLKTTSQDRGIETYDAASWVGELWGSAKLILHLNRPPSGSGLPTDSR
jgi:hypothetical protein